jgi:hypothetical protein
MAAVKLELPERNVIQVTGIWRLFDFILMPSRNLPTLRAQGICLGIPPRRFKVTSACSDLYICEISSSHGGEYDVQSCLLGCTAV